MLGTTIGGYRLERKLGEGGMGEVYVGVHELIGKRVAVKVLREEHSQNVELVNRFFKEARATALLAHSGCVDIIDTGRTPAGRGYIIMTLLEGESLKDRLARERLAPVVQLSIARQIADVLAAAHDKGIIHRDIKPENVFLVGDEAAPSRVRVKVLDFGVAKLADAGFQQAATNPNALIGTPAYMAPEQCKGAQFVDQQSDVYAVGIILYEMACGRPPFVCRGFGDYIMAHLTQAPPRPSTLTTIDPRYEKIILHALEKEKRDRTPTMAALIRELDTLQTTATSQPNAATVLNLSSPLAPPPQNERQRRPSHEVETIKAQPVPPELLAAHAQRQKEDAQRKRDAKNVATSSRLPWLAAAAVAAAVAGLVTWLVLR